MAFKEALEGLAKGARGPAPAFSKFDFVRTLELITRGPIGRASLSKELGLGEGSVRTLMDRLERAGLVRASKKGFFLTKEGEELWNELKSVLSKAALNGTELSLSKRNVMILIKGRERRVRNGMEQRDAAVKAGAEAAITLVVRGGKLMIPPDFERVKEDYPKAFEKVVGALSPEEGDAIVISCANTIKEAERGALAAAWTLL